MHRQHFCENPAGQYCHAECWLCCSGQGTAVPRGVSLLDQALHHAGVVVNALLVLLLLSPAALMTALSVCAALF